MQALFDAAGLTVLERGWLSSNNVLFGGGEAHEAVLVDSGYCTHAPQTVALVRRALGTLPLRRIVNTHLHSDHCGGNHALQEAFDCAISVPAGEAAKVDAWDETALTYGATGQHCPRFRRTESVLAGDWVRCGGRQWQAIAIPGHDPESIALYEPDLQLLISADALWENGFGVVFPELDGEHAFEEVRSTLDALARLPVRVVIPGHGRPFDDMPAAIGRAHRRLDGFIADPVRHARHAAKVLIKFHLLEVQQQELDDAFDWMASTAYMTRTHGRYFATETFAVWCTGLLTDLAASGALVIRSGMLVNI